jgi:predicted DNA-binding ribbon-helix-helix protein
MLHSESLSQPLIRTNVFLSKFQRESLKTLAAAQDISMAELARRILDRHLRRATNSQAAREVENHSLKEQNHGKRNHQAMESR